MAKEVKYFKLWAKMYKILKCFEKRQVTACNYRTQQMLK